MKPLRKMPQIFGRWHWQEQPGHIRKAFTTIAVSINAINFELIMHRNTIKTIIVVVIVAIAAISNLIIVRRLLIKGNNIKAELVGFEE